MRTRSEVKRPAETKRISSSKDLSRKQPQTSDEERRNTAAVQHETKIRTPIRTPKLKSPKRRHSVHTPGRDDVLCSQHFDSQVVVGWDCNSPDTLRGIKRISGSEQHGDVSDLVMRLIGEDGDDDIFTKRSTPPLLGVWREDHEDKLLDDNTTISHRLRRNRARQRKKSGKDSAVSKDLLNKLSLALDKCNEEEEEKEEREAVTTKRHNCSDDLFNSESNNYVEVEFPRTSSRLIGKKYNGEIKDNAQNTESVGNQKPDVLKALKKLPLPEQFDEKIEKYVEQQEETWSDDELFEEDSFIVKATQLAEDTKKFVSPVFAVKRKTSGDSELPKSKSTRYTFQLGSDDEIDKDSRCEKFTSLQNKQAESSLSRSTGGVNNNNNTKLQVHSAVTASSINRNTTVTASSYARSNTVTSSSSNRPPVYPVTSYRSTKTCSNVNLGKSVQKSSGCGNINLGKSVQKSSGHGNINLGKSVQKSSGHGNPVIAGSDATKDLIIPETRQRGTAHVISNNSCSVDKPLNSQSSSAFTNVSFKKHSSFSGTNSLNLVSNTSRRRSVSGDNCLNNTSQGGTSVLKSFGNASSCNSERSNTARLYPAASRSSVISSSIKSVVPSCGSNKSQYPVMNTAASSYNVISSSSRKSTTLSCTSTTTRLQYGTVNSGQPACATNTKSNYKELPEKVWVESKRLSIGGFDTSLSDLLCQLAEPDQILDSQASFNVTSTPVRHIPQTSSSVSSNHISVKPSNVMPDMNSCHRRSVINGGLNTRINKVDSKQPVKQYKFKKSSSPTGNKQCVVTEKSGASSHGSAAKTKGPALEQYSEDLFASDDDDDMLLADDDGLTEPQILAMLDEVELLATQQQVSQKSSCVETKGHSVETKPTALPGTPLQGSQEQSTRRCRTSDQGTGLPGSQGQVAGSQGQLPGSQGQLPGSQGLNSSQTKYSPLEIERKKQEAIERRKRKLKKV